MTKKTWPWVKSDDACRAPGQLAGKCDLWHSLSTERNCSLPQDHWKCVYRGKRIPDGKILHFPTEKFERTLTDIIYCIYALVSETNYVQLDIIHILMFLGNTFYPRSCFYSWVQIHYSTDAAGYDMKCKYSDNSKFLPHHYHTIVWSCMVCVGSASNVLYMSKMVLQK